MTTVTLADLGNASDYSTLTQRGFQAHLTALVENISRVVVAPEETIRYLLIGLMSEGHVLLAARPRII